MIPFLKSDYFLDRSERILFDVISEFFQKYNALPTPEALHIELDKLGDINEDDIRVCTVPSYQGKGVAKFMLDKIKYMYPNAIGKIKKDNIASQKLFDKCKVPYTII